MTESVHDLSVCPDCGAEGTALMTCDERYGNNKAVARVVLDAQLDRVDERILSATRRGQTFMAQQLEVERKSYVLEFHRKMAILKAESDKVDRAGECVHAKLKEAIAQERQQRGMRMPTGSPPAHEVKLDAPVFSISLPDIYPAVKEAFKRAVGSRKGFDMVVFAATLFAVRAFKLDPAFEKRKLAACAFLVAFKSFKERRHCDAFKIGSNLAIHYGGEELFEDEIRFLEALGFDTRIEDPYSMIHSRLKSLNMFRQTRVSYARTYIKTLISSREFLEENFGRLLQPVETEQSPYYHFVTHVCFLAERAVLKAFQKES
jgi:hypothetical protein